MPFRVKDGYAWGPGALDMKAGIVTGLEALRAIAAPPRPVHVLITADEEVGSPTGRPLVEEMATGARAVLVLEPPVKDGTITTSRSGLARYQLHIRGRAAHAGNGSRAGVSAVEELAHQITAVHALADPAGASARMSARSAAAPATTSWPARRGRGSTPAPGRPTSSARSSARCTPCGRISTAPCSRSPAASPGRRWCRRRQPPSSSERDRDRGAGRRQAGRERLAGRLGRELRRGGGHSRDRRSRAHGNGRPRARRARLAGVDPRAHGPSGSAACTPVGLGGFAVHAANEGQVSFRCFRKECDYGLVEGVAQPVDGVGGTAAAVIGTLFLDWYSFSLRASARSPRA